MRLSRVMVEQVKLAVWDFLCAMGGAFEEGGVRGIPSANGVVVFRRYFSIGVAEIIVRIWEAGCERRCFFIYPALCEWSLAVRLREML